MAKIIGGEPNRDLHIVAGLRGTCPLCKVLVETEGGERNIP